MADSNSPIQPAYHTRDALAVELCASLEEKILTHGVPLSSESCREGNVSFVTGDEPIGGALKLFGEWAQSEISLLSRFISRGEVVLDVGSNIGCHTLSFCDLVGSTGYVHAFEPQPLAADLTAYNLFRNGRQNFSVWQIGLGDSAATFTVPSPTHSSIKNLGGVSLSAKSDESNREITVKAFSLDSLNLGKADFIKCDVEGMEPQVLQGAKTLLADQHPTLYLECNDLSHGVALFQQLERLGYTLFLHRAKAFNPFNFKQERENPFGVSHEINLLAVHHSRPSLLEMASSLADSSTLLKTSTIDDLGKAFFETPRYGDATDIDRNPTALRKSLDATNFGLHDIARKAAIAESYCKALISITELLSQTSMYLAPAAPPKSFGSMLRDSFSGAHRVSPETISKIQHSPLFNLDYMRSQCEGFPTSVEDAVARYLNEKSLWTIDTHPFFLARYYQITHLISTETSPLLHFLVTSAKESYHTHPLLKGINNIPAFLSTPWQEREEQPAIFDQEWYLHQHPDLKASGCDPVLHFAQFGWKEGRDPHSRISGALLLKTLNETTSPFLYFLLLEQLTTAA
jgi:FkbM family methyltransferase